MKFKMERLGLFILILMMFSCSSIKSGLERARDFQNRGVSDVYLNSIQHPIQLDSVYLDRKNIDAIMFYKQSNAIIIHQNNLDAEFLKLSDVNEPYKSIVLNGELLSTNDIKNIRLESSIIKSFILLNSEDLNADRSTDETHNRTILITTKK